MDELQLFLEDASEQLSLMEDGLINIQDNGIDDESVAAVFRAMHTIKGTAGMFGFGDVVEFTHVAENLLSEIRSHKKELDKEDFSDLFFSVKDMVEVLIRYSVNHLELDDENSKKRDRLLTKLKSLLGEEVQSVNQKESQSETSTSNSQKKLWHISIRLEPTFFTSGMDFLSILRFMKDDGELKNLLLVDENIPKIDELNPTLSYAGFEILFLTDKDKEGIEEIFEFVLDDMKLEIFLADDLQAFKKIVDTNETLLKRLAEQSFENAINYKKSIEKTEPQKPKNPQKRQNQAEHKSFSLRVDSSKIDKLMNQISEMVIANARIMQRADNLNDDELNESALIMSDMLEEIRSDVMNIRMVQVGDSFKKFRRIVHDIAKKLGKEIEFEIIGGETELDKMVVEKISDPLVHMLRNSIDHGIEPKDERVKEGKDPKGRVVLKTYPDAGTIVIEISDDGKGLDKEKILNKAIENGIVQKDQELSDKEIYNLIFHAGLSTAREVSDISGRGVGMDVVRSNIESLRGTVDIDSTEGKGTTFTIRLPLTLAIIDGFLVQSGKTKYIIPLEMIQECIELDENYRNQMKINGFINLRDTILPLLDIRKYFKEENSDADRENVVVVRYGEFKMGLVVDELFGEFQTVIKPLGKVFSKVPGISGGTILGSGEIALIFDIPKLIEHKIKTTQNKGE